MDVDYHTHFAYGVILDEFEIIDEYPNVKDDEDLSFATFGYFELVNSRHVYFYGVSIRIVGDDRDDHLSFRDTDPQTWTDAMKNAKDNFDKTSLAGRAKFHVFMASS